MSESLKFLQERIAKNEKFCMICLRREHETRLVPPTSLNSFVTSMKKSSFALCYGEMACSLCENACRNALSLVKAFENTEKMYEILFQPDPPATKKSRRKVQDSTEKLANDCIDFLRQHREATTLKISETLVVSSDSPMECNFQSPPPPNLGLPNSIPTDTDPVITIIDDDDQTDADERIVDSEHNLFKVDKSTQLTRATAKRVLLKHQPITANITKTYPQKEKNKAVGADKEAVGSYIIMDVNDGNVANKDNLRNLNLNVKAQALHNSVNTVPKLVTMEEFLQRDPKNCPLGRNVACFWNDQKKLLVKLQDSCVVHDVVVYEDRFLVPFMSCEIKEGKLMYVPNLFPAPNLSSILAQNLKSTKANGANNVKISGFEVETSKFIETTNGTDLDKALEEVMKDMQAASRDRSSDGGLADSTVSDPLFVIESVKSEAIVELSDDDEPPQPVQVSFTGPVQKGRIDWEDKIPMDVISVVESDNTMLILPD